MRIIRGKLKSRRLTVPKGFNSRPTTNFAKEGLFNVIDNNLDLEGKTVLDLCSGTGNITLEFASSEVKRVTAVDKNYACTRFLKHLAIDLQIADQVEIVKADILTYIKKTDQTFDIIFADPPYDLDVHQEILNIVIDRKLLKEDGWLIIEHGKETIFGGMEPTISKKYSSVYFSFFNFSEEE